jgi:uncharacterized protein (TIGR04141 family)
MEKKMEDAKSQINIYRIQDSDLESLSEIVDKKGYYRQQLQQEEVNGFSLLLFYKDKPSNPNWKEFLRQHVEPGQAILIPDVSRTEGFVLLLLNTETEKLYAVTGGTGYFAIQEHIDEDFGIDIFSRLIKKDEKIIRTTKDKTNIGGI